MTNEERAALGLKGLEAGTDLLADDPDDIETYVGDMIANLMHLCDDQGVDYRAAEARGIMHYGAETDEEKLEEVADA
jgi:hypothetical protein